MSIQMTRRIHVSAGRKSIMPTQHRMPSTGMRGTKGVRKARSAAGIVRRTTITPAHTRVKAKSVPMLVISPATRAGTSPASTLTSTMKSMLLRAGVWKRLLMWLNTGGSSPSRLML